MGGAKATRSLLIGVLASLIGYLGILTIDVGQPPARVVDAVADTNSLAVGTAAYFSEAPGAEARTPPALSTSTTAIEPTTATTRPVTVTTRPSASATVTSSSTTTTAAVVTSTTRLPTTPPPPTVRQRGEQAMAGFSYDWQAGLPGWEISFHPGRSGVLGFTFVQEKRIEVYVRADMSDSLLAHVIAHEVGHAIDVTHNTGDDRRRWQELRGISDKPWWPGNGATDFSTGAGDFAESFAAWQVGNTSFRSKLGDAPSADEVALLAELAG